MNTQRDVFFDVIKENKNDKVVIISNDFGAKSLNEINGSNWYISIQPSEQLAITMATGMALKGFKPYVYMMCPFVTRAFEQIHLMCSMNLPVTIVGAGAGLSYDTAGVTHHAINDLNALRCIPNMTIVNVSTLGMAAHYAKESLIFEKPLYIRLDKLTNESDITFYELGWSFLRLNYNKIALFSTGTICKYLYDNTEFDIFEIFRFPCDSSILLDFFNVVRYDKIISVEENYINGGLGDYLLPLGLGLKLKKVGLTGFCESKQRNDYWKLLVDEVKRKI
jgi:transketolase